MLSDACQALSSLHHLSFPHEKSWGFWDQLFCCWSTLTCRCAAWSWAFTCVLSALSKLKRSNSRAPGGQPSSLLLEQDSPRTCSRWFSPSTPKSPCNNLFLAKFLGAKLNPKYISLPSLTCTSDFSEAFPIYYSNDLKSQVGGGLVICFASRGVDDLQNRLCSLTENLYFSKAALWKLKVWVMILAHWLSSRLALTGPCLCSLLPRPYWRAPAAPSSCTFSPLFPGTTPLFRLYGMSACTEICAPWRKKT